jgi:hypothetical protein
MGIFQGQVGRIPMWISWLWPRFGFSIGAKILSMKKTIVINLLLIIAYYLFLQFMLWMAWIAR